MQISVVRRQQFLTIFFISIGRGERILVYCSSRVRTLVAMATYSLHILVMGKVEIDTFPSQLA